MKQIPVLLFLAILLSASCQRSNNSTSPEKGLERLADTLAYARLLEGFEKEFAAIEAEYDSASAERQLELEASFEELDLEMAEAQKQFVRDYPASPQALLVLNEVDWSFETASEYRKILSCLDPALQESPLYKELDDLVGRMEHVEIGKQAPDFAMADVDGISRKLSDLHGASSYLLLDFWASHCGPCRIENANIRLAYDRFHEQGFDVLGVSTDTRREHWINAIALDGLIWTNVCSLEPWKENKVVSNYALRQVSQNFLLDQSGKIIAKDLRGEELIATLESLLK